MEAVVLNSDIARLVLDYLRRENLEDVAHTFCKTSPYLKKQYSLYKQGFVPHSFFPELEEMICEYAKVDKLFLKMPDSLRNHSSASKLSDKVSYLYERTLELLQQRSVMKSHSKCVQSPQSSTSSRRKCSYAKKRKNEAILFSSEESISEKNIKRRRLAQPFYRLGGGKQLQLIKTAALSTTAYELSSEETSNIDEYEEVGEADDEIVFLGDHAKDVTDNLDVNMSNKKKPIKESTPKTGTHKSFKKPSVPELTQVILENSEFQTKLVENINQVLQQNPEIESNSAIETQNRRNSDAVSSNDLLERIVKNIMEATETDPTFDDIINEIVGRPVTTTTSPENVDVNDNTEMRQVCTDVNGNNETKQITSACNNSSDNTEDTSRTPSIIRSAVAGQNPQILNTNNSLSPLIDPNFSISKLLIFNDCNHKTSEGAALKGSGANLITELASSIEPAAKATTTTVATAPAGAIVNNLAEINEGGENVLGEQIFFDTNTSLTFPVLITNDGLYPLYLHTDAVKNMDNVLVFHSDGPATATTTTTPSLSTTVPVTTTTTTRTTTVTVESVPPTLTQNVGQSSLKSIIGEQRLTPMTSGIVNVKAFRSMSTPRKQASHVRTLTFSPGSLNGLSLADATPLSHRVDFLAQRREQRAFKAVTEEKRINLVQETPVINEVEVLISLDSASVAIETDNSSNSCNMPPLLVGKDDTSNETVIKLDKEHEQINPRDSACSSEGKETPRNSNKSRQQALKSCKRQLSKSPPFDESITTTATAAAESENTEDVEESKEQGRTRTENLPTPITDMSTEKERNDLMKENEKNQSNTEIPSNKPVEIVQNSVKDKLMEEWRRLRETSTHDLDSRLRQLNVEMGNTLASQKTIRKTPRRRKRPALKRKEIQAAEKAALELDTSTATEIAQADDKDNNEVENGGQPASAAALPKKNAKKTQRKLNLKVPLNVQLPKEPKKNVKRKDALKKPLAKTKTNKNENEEVTATEDLVESLVDTVSSNKAPLPQSTVNMAGLLETPCKVPSPLTMTMPPTPGCLASIEIQNNTPYKETIDTASFLFGSLSKSILGETPILSAITPGFRFTPFGTQETTPRSGGGKTDYSSGGGSSYYKPDESEDVERNLDKIVRQNSVRDIQQSEEDVGVVTSDELEHMQLQEALCVEIPLERVKVEPNVLKRVKSFGYELEQSAADTQTAPHMSPHYTLASGLPEISAAEEDSDTTSSSSSSASSSSSSDSSSSDCSSNSSNSSSTTSESSNKSQKCAVGVPQTVDLLDQQLSEISSTEDEEWMKTFSADTLEQENSQIVSTDGEVRYPLRSWLTPSKDQAVQSLKVTLALKATEKAAHEQDLASKRERMKAKLKNDPIPQKPRTSNRTLTIAAAAARKEMGARFEKAKQKPVSPQHVPPPPEMLTALSLSAKKPLVTEASNSVETTSSTRIVTDIDDNAVSTLFSSAKTPVPAKTKGKLEVSALLKKVQPQTSSGRQVIKIDARPKLTHTGKRKGVLTPLGFKRGNVVASPNKKLSRATKAKETKRLEVGKRTLPNKSTAAITTPVTAKRNKNRASPRLARAIKTTESSDVTKDLPKQKAPGIKTVIKYAVKKHEILEQQAKQIEKTKLDEEKKKEKNKPILNLTESATEIIAKDDKERHDVKQNVGRADNANTINEEVNSLNIEKLTVLPDAEVSAVVDIEPATSEYEDEEFDLVTITELDKKRFVSIVYNGPDEAPKQQPIKYEFSDIVVAIDEFEKHTWSISNEICLFECAPVKIKPKLGSTTTRSQRQSGVLPKKRKIRVISSSEGEETQQARSNTTSFLQKNQKTLGVEELNDTSLQDITAESIKIDDIETILSHLHGT